MVQAPKDWAIRFSRTEVKQPALGLAAGILLLAGLAHCTAVLGSQAATQSRSPVPVAGTSFLEPSCCLECHIYAGGYMPGVPLEVSRAAG